MSKVIAGRIKALERQLADLKREHNRELRTSNAVATGEKPAPSIEKLIASQSFSYGVNFLRRKPVKGVMVNVSQRRFSSVKEAAQHGKRFAAKHRHQAYFVTVTQQRANAWVNWKTGKTNPVLR